MDVSIGARIKAARTAAGMTQMDVARGTDLSLQAVGDIERGIVRDPHISSLRQIAYALDVPVEMLVKEEEAEPALPLDEAPQEEEEESGPPVVHFAKLSDNAYEEVRENARTLEERSDLRRRVDVEYEQLSRWVRGLREEEEVGAPSGDIDEARDVMWPCSTYQNVSSPSTRNARPDSAAQRVRLWTKLTRKYRARPKRAPHRGRVRAPVSSSLSDFLQCLEDLWGRSSA